MALFLVSSLPLISFPWAVRKSGTYFPPCFFKLPNNLSWSHLTEMSKSQTCHMNSRAAQRTDTERVAGTSLLFPSKRVNVLWFSCHNDLKITHQRTHIRRWFLDGAHESAPRCLVGNAALKIACPLCCFSFFCRGSSVLTTLKISSVALA